MIRDLWGHVAEGGRDDRTWLDHGRWPLAHRCRRGPACRAAPWSRRNFPAVDAPGVMQIPLGPIHGAIEEPAHLRLAARGETVLRAEARLGYAHKGTLALMRGKSPRTAARFVARLAAEATVAHALAFARATEAALDVAAPPRAAALRAVMAELERIAGHLDDLARMADAAGLAPLHAAAGRQRELLLRAAERAFGHRLMMDVVVPGGVAADIAPEGAAAIRAPWRRQRCRGCGGDWIRCWRGWRGRRDRRLGRRRRGGPCRRARLRRAVARSGLLRSAWPRRQSMRAMPRRAAGCGWRRSPTACACCAHCSTGCRRGRPRSPCRRTAARVSAAPSRCAALSGTGCAWTTARSPPPSRAIPAGRCGRWWRQQSPEDRQRRQT